MTNCKILSVFCYLSSNLHNDRINNVEMEVDEENRKGVMAQKLCGGVILE